jgi:crossover junction endodeoxyribonuclease RuvC
MRIFGVDPGLRLTGYACLGCSPDAPLTPTLIEAGVFRLAQRSTTKDAAGVTTSTAASVSARLVELDRDFREALDRLKPDIVAVESLFAHYKHPATAIVMGHARGVLLLAIKHAGCQLVELKPNEVKKSLTGHGHASKSQMQSAVQSVFGLAEPPDPPDIADAIAIALCAATRSAVAEV